MQWSNSSSLPGPESTMEAPSPIVFSIWAPLIKSTNKFNITCLNRKVVIVQVQLARNELSDFLN